MNPMLASELGCRHTAVELFEDRYDLRLGEATFLQERVSLTGLYARKLTTPAGPKSALHVTLGMLVPREFSERIKNNHPHIYP